MFEYTTLTVKILGGRSGVISWFQSKSIDAESQQRLSDMGRAGWEMTGVVPVGVGALGASSVDSAICFFKRSVEVRRGATNTAAANKNGLNGEEFDWLLKRRMIGDKWSAGKGHGAELGESDWGMIVTAAYPEAIPAVEEYLQTHSGIEHLLQERRHAIKQFYSQLTRPDQIRAAYSLLENQVATDLAMQLIQDYKLFDAAAIKQLLEHPVWNMRVMALEVAAQLKPHYCQADVAALEEVLELVIQVFTPVPLESRKGMLGKCREVWVCRCCERENAAAAPGCDSCPTDRYGIPNRLGGLADVRMRLERRITVLSEAFSTRETESGGGSLE